jgi:small subunit ribosomal protein S6
MNDYEVLLMLDPELPEERGNEIIARIREQAEAGGGSWDAQEPWGRRRLAYEIDHKAEGTYHLLLFTAEPTALEEITRVLKITDGVMRHLAVRRVKGGSIKAPATIAAPAAPAVEAAPTAPPAAEAVQPVEAPEPESDVEAVAEPADDADAAAE